ncbi:MAG: hypoxanthine phosphoribosyltransferase [Acidobacteriota bacterium]|nr:MAG: hypoxanthine phosphoribosyltransferase [Acidobacteriota bacterium]
MLDWASELGEVLIPQEKIRERVKELGREISEVYPDGAPVVVGVLRGASVFHADLIRELHFPLSIDFMAVASYGNATRNSGEVKLIKDLETSVGGADVLLVEDIVDTGLTLSYLLGNIRNRQPRSLRVCSFLSKPARRAIDVTVDFLGFEIPDRFVVGYGLDYQQRYRNLPFVATLKGI